MAETDPPTGEDGLAGLAALLRTDVASTAPLRNDSRLLDAAPLRTPVLDSGVASATRATVDSVRDAVVVDTSRLSDAAPVPHRDRDSG